MAHGGGPKQMIVAAIDFGTAYSGYAFSFYHTFKDDPTKISTNAWATGTGGLMSLKTSTCALFDSEKKFHSFGFGAEDKYSDLALDGAHGDWYFFKCFKMDLFKKVKLNRHFKLEDTIGKTLPAIDVFAGSIGFLKNHLLKTCRDRIPETQENDIRWVLTVPAIWDDAAKQFMREAAIEAGIPEERLVIALEPEAASIFCRYLPIGKFSGLKSGFKPFQPGSKYLVLDAGGGTIDITVHEVKYDGSLSEVFKASGGNWGGTYVDKAFEHFLAEIVGKDIMKQFAKEETADYLDLFRSFEVKKRAFETKLTSKVMFKVPVSLNELFRTKKGGKNIKDVIKSTKYAEQVVWAGDKLRLAPEIVNGIFDEPCQSIVDHLQKLFQKPQLADVNMILMVGGFSESLMLQEYVRTGFPEKIVIVPQEPGLVVLKGAVIFGHDTGAISERKSKYTYGIETAVPFKENKHPEEKEYYDGEGTRLCLDIFDTHVKIGQTIQTGESQVTKEYCVTTHDQSKVSFNVFASKKLKPKFVTDPKCLLIGSLDVDVPGFGMERGVEVNLMFGDTELHVTAIESQSGETTSAKFDFLCDKGDDDSESDEGSEDSGSDEDDDDDDDGDNLHHIIEQFLTFEDDDWFIESDSNDSDF